MSARRSADISSNSVGISHEIQAFGFQGEYGCKAELKLMEGHNQEWSLWINLTQQGEPHQVRTWEGLTNQELFFGWLCMAVFSWWSGMSG